MDREVIRSTCMRCGQLHETVRLYDSFICYECLQQIKNETEVQLGVPSELLDCSPATLQEVELVELLDIYEHCLDVRQEAWELLVYAEINKRLGVEDG